MNTEWSYLCGHWVHTTVVLGGPGHTDSLIWFVEAWNKLSTLIEHDNSVKLVLYTTQGSGSKLGVAPSFS